MKNPPGLKTSGRTSSSSLLISGFFFADGQQWQSLFDPPPSIANSDGQTKIKVVELFKIHCK
ncbi:hypothetical protein DERP_010190 [Dermatophagoides pteronyssinus]|uniref:Uncharacterized protein n=1 Tax=Dermatophagoides pteronyssinus TaxID=6956 RepID=A0ABQ8J708_DERPT|nr:hypothetical protein DERP_010190 [Dermatophagoides pteronyssinus]